MEVRAFAPGTVANVSCGFDIMGFALESPGDVVTARRREAPGVVMARVSGDGGKLPCDGRNTAAVAAARLLERAGSDAGVELELEKGMPLSSGLGSSAASSVAAVVAVDALLGTGLSTLDLLHCALEGERAAAGVPHADNAAPSLVGGFVLVRGSGADARYHSLPVPGELAVAMCHPRIEIHTREARRILPERIALADAVTQWFSCSALVAGLCGGDWDLIREGVRDVVAEPVRAPQVPGFAAMCDAARDAGALGCGLSGSGPSLFALCRGRDTAKRVCAAMKERYEGDGHGTADAWASAVGARGARVLD
ncbi:MAG TPA: homoserine kinase [bacterium]|nr:homoserine kinase [bacterium]